MLLPGQDGAIVPSGHPQAGQLGQENVRRRPWQVGQDAEAGAARNRFRLPETAPRMVLHALSGSDADMTVSPPDGSSTSRDRIAPRD